MANYTVADDQIYKDLVATGIAIYPRASRSRVARWHVRELRTGRLLASYVYAESMTDALTKFARNYWHDPAPVVQLAP